MFHRPRPRVPIGAPYSCFGPGDSRLQAGPAPAGCANSHAAPDHLPRRWRLPKLSEGRRARSPLRVAPHSSSCHSATRTIPAAYTMRIAILDGADDETQRPRLCRFSRLAARFSSNDLAGFFLPSFFRSMPLLMSLPLFVELHCEFYPTVTTRRSWPFQPLPDSFSAWRNMPHSQRILPSLPTPAAFPWVFARSSSRRSSSPILTGVAQSSR